MLTVDCADVISIQNELVVYVADKVEAIPTLKNHQFTLSTLDDEIIDVELVISAIKEYFDKDLFVSLPDLLVHESCWLD